MKPGDQNLLKELTIESREHLANIEPDLLALEKGEGVSEEVINRVFRAVHSIKGGFGFFSFDNIKKLSHAMESVMMLIRDGQMKVTPKVVDALLQGKDKLSLLLDNVDQSDHTDIGDEEKILQELAKSANASGPDLFPESLHGDSTPDPWSLQTIPADRDKILDAARKGQCVHIILVKPKKGSRENRGLVESLQNEMTPLGEILSSSPAEPGDPGRNGATHIFVFASVLESDMLVATFEIPASDIITFDPKTIREQLGTVSPPPPKVQDSPVRKQSSAASSEKHVDSSESIRVRVELLNKLVNLAGELVLGRNQLLQSLKDTQEGKVKGVLQNINRVTSELQESILNTRMQPIGGILGKFPRIVRDMARSSGKEIELNLSGEKVELDKSILEALADPLTHLVRNSVDHGIEDPQTREKAEKPRMGRIMLRAFHEGGEVNIQIRDDGKGIDPEKIRRKAVDKGILPAEEAAELSVQEVYNLIFLPGFSTAGRVTEISGRGVGMDVVRNNVESLGGVVEIDSHLGEGTIIVLKLPLTLAIIPSLIVASEGLRFAIPQVSLEELVRLRPDEAAQRIEMVQGHQVLRLRDKLLPLLRLNQVLGLNQTYPEEKEEMRARDKRTILANRRNAHGRNTQNVQEEADRRQRTRDRRQSHQSSINIAVLKVGSNQYGLVVEKLIDSEEIVVKPLSDYLKRCKAYSGSTIMGDGKAAMILDAQGIADMCKLQFGVVAGEERRQALAGARQVAKETQSLLFFRNATPEILALDLSMITRIEKIHKSSIEKVGNKEYLKYRDHSLRIIRPYDFMPIQTPAQEPDHLCVIIPKLVRHPMGIVTFSVLEVVESGAHVEKTNVKGTGVHGSMIINDQLVTLVDIYSLFEAAEPEIYGRARTSLPAQKGRVLLAEDTEFFRTLETNYLESLGFEVEAVPHGGKAWEKLQAGDYDLLLTDLVMPVMDGIELIRQVRQDPKHQHLPIIALTAIATKAMHDRAVEAGVDAFELKLDKERLSEAMARVLKERKPQVA